jgi:hypothetical protein
MQVGFLVWSLVLCLVVRFLGVYLLTFIVNQFRIKPINLQVGVFLNALLKLVDKTFHLYVELQTD